MKSHFPRILLGALCILAALLAGAFTLMTYTGVVAPMLKHPPNAANHYSVDIGGFQLHDRQAYVLPVAGAVTTVGLLWAGCLSLASARNDEP